MPGPLALVGGDEFHPGNEAQDGILRDAAAGRAAYVVATAARTGGDAAVGAARRWFATLGIEISELRVRTPGDARSTAVAAEASAAGLIYLAGGDPGRVVEVLRGTPVWDAIVAAWRGGAALAGSSAGAMALCRWSLVRAGWPGHSTRRPADALELVPDCAVLPHYDTFGAGWIPSAHAALGEGALLVGIDERTAAVFGDGAWRVLGPGAVTLVRGDLTSRFAAGSLIEGMPEPKP